MPQERPFGEQVSHARLLAGRGLCVTAAPWPGRAEWPTLLESALETGGDGWAEVSDGFGAERAAVLLRELAATTGGSRVA